MNIPDEALEAAFKSMYGPGPSNHSNAGDAHLLKELRKALEAAVPALLVEAWDAGYHAAVMQLKVTGRPVRNPYLAP